MFIPVKRRHILTLLMGVLLVSCSQNTTYPDTSIDTGIDTGREVLGIGSIDITLPSIDAPSNVQPASFESGYANIPSELIITAPPVTQLTFGTANGVSGRYLLTRLKLRNISERNLNNLTLLGISLAGADQSLTPFSNVLTIIGSPVSDANALYQIKPSQPISLSGVTNASFVAFDESDLDSDLRNTINGIPGANVAALLPYGFRVGNVTAGQDATVDIGFFIPDGNPVGRFSFRFIAVTDNLERVTQGISEIDIAGNRDNGYAAVRQRFGNPASNKTLVLTGSFEREVSQADIDSGIFTLLPDIRIAGAAGSPLATLFDSSSTAVAQISAAGQNTDNATEINDILLAHNQYRAEVGVAPLSWSASLASEAQAWADVLATENTLRHEGGGGENLARGAVGFFSATDFINNWGSEQEFFIPNGTFPDGVSTTGDWTDVGHYTQIIWSATTEVGCGMAENNSNSFFVCRYSPAGNIIGQKPY